MLAHLLINIDPICDKTSFGRGREGPCPEQPTAWWLGQSTLSVISEGSKGDRGTPPPPHLLLKQLLPVLCLEGKVAFSKKLAVPLGINWSTQLCTCNSVSQGHVQLTEGINQGSFSSCNVESCQLGP